MRRIIFLTAAVASLAACEAPKRETFMEAYTRAQAANLAALTPELRAVYREQLLECFAAEEHSTLECEERAWVATASAARLDAQRGEG